MLSKQIQKQKRHCRIRAKIKGSSHQPRLCVFRSHKHIYLQIINDENSRVLISAADTELKEKKAKIKTEKAGLVGELLAKKALAKGIKKVIFDRAGYKYHGRVKAAAEGARGGGLEF